MGDYGSASYWLFKPEAWALLGLLLIGFEMLVGNLFALPIGVACLFVAGMTYGQEEMWYGDTVLFETWRQILIAFAVLSVLSVGIIKFLVQKKSPDDEDDDINQY